MKTTSAMKRPRFGRSPGSDDRRPVATLNSITVYQGESARVHWLAAHLSFKSIRFLLKTMCHQLASGFRPQTMLSGSPKLRRCGGLQIQLVVERLQIQLVVERLQIQLIVEPASLFGCERP